MKPLSAGKGPPYWYEWTVGLLKVVDMLYPESDITSVSFQEAGIKGWDDVIVRYAADRTDYIQVKHTRDGRNITFGTFVSQEDGDSLLGTLYAAWREMKLSPGQAKCIVFTNREAGERGHKARPPLLKFMTWLKGELETKSALSDAAVPSEWNEAWQEWLIQLREGADAERLDFLRCLDVQTNQPDLEGLEQNLVNKLADALGASPAAAQPLLHALDNALRRWTDKHERVTVEDVCDALMLENDPDTSPPAPPPPAPFFPTREQEARTIEQTLAAKDEAPVVFLSAAPGAGKTSVLSRVVARRTDKPLSGIVGLRYFAFFPLTPDSPLTPADTDYCVRPERLWRGLLSQLRHELRGKLWEYKVPVRNDLLDWRGARDHVLRIADRLGNELGRDFTILIDGIDHAARAGRYEPAVAHDFFESLPGPSQLRGRRIRLFLAGQPAENYAADYPMWLRTPNPKVKKLTLGGLDKADIAMLVRDGSPPLPVGEWDEAVEVITESAKGNALAVVCGIEEAKSCRGIAELKARLRNRCLHEGLQSYYESIWRHTFDGIPEKRIGVETALAGTLSLARERTTGTLMAKAFASLGHSPEEWHLLLTGLGPLVTEKAGRFELLHNDVRVFFANDLAGRAEGERKWVACALADYYLSPESDRRAAHVSLLPLLRASGRELEWAKVFSMHWVFEAAALDLPFPEVAHQCATALHLGCELRDWNVMDELACATETLERWEDRTRGSSEANREQLPNGSTAAPFFPPSELAVLPTSKWNLGELSQVLNDVSRILQAKDAERGFALLRRWFEGMTLVELADRICDTEGNPNLPARLNSPLGEAEAAYFEHLGATCRAARFHFVPARMVSEQHQAAAFHFERGWIEQSVKLGPFSSVSRCLDGRWPHWYDGFARLTQGLASNGRRPLVGRLLRLLAAERDKFSSDFQALAAWWSLWSGVAKRCPGWLDALKAPKVGFSSQDRLEAPLAVCRARGWMEPATHPSTIAEQVFAKLERAEYREKSAPQYRLLFRTAAVLGRLAALAAQSKLDAARDLIRPQEVSQLAEALWDESAGVVDLPFHRSLAGELALELVRVVYPLSEAHAEALVEAACPAAERWPGGFPRTSLWEVLRRAGKIRLLQRWVEHVIGPEGVLWTDSADSREPYAEEFLQLAGEVGLESLANQARQRLRWQRIGYRCHKDYSFRWPCLWFEELAEFQPTCWRTFGLRLLSLCEACSAQGGDNRWSSEVNESVGAAAVASGPADTLQLLLAEQPSCGTNQWLNQTVARYVNGLAKHAARKPALSLDEKTACWCLAVGMTQWSDNNDVSRIAELRRALVDGCSTDTERQEFMRILSKTTPGEAVREPIRDDMPGSGTSEAQEAPATWRERLAAGTRLRPAEALAAVRELQGSDPDDVGLVTQVLESFGDAYSLSGGWRADAKTRAILADLARIVPDAALWSLMRSAVRLAGNNSYWFSAAQENVQLVLLARASVRGAPELTDGLHRVLNMHERWAGGGDGSIPLPAVKPTPPAPVTNWRELAAQVLVFLLASRSAKVIQAAIVGLQALVERHPDSIVSIFALSEADEWKTGWILNAAEVWAVECPQHLAAAKTLLEEHCMNGTLRIRLQAWVTLTLLAKRLGEPEPQPPVPRLPKPGGRETIVHAPGDILQTATNVQGTFRFVDRYEAARSIIERVESVLGCHLDEIRDRVGTRLLEVQIPTFRDRPWPQQIRNSLSTLLVNEEGQALLDEEFKKWLAEAGLPKAAWSRLAQCYLDNEDPWILRHSPHPAPSLAAWPREEALSGDYSKPPPSQLLREQLRSVAQDVDVPGDEVVIAAKLCVFSWREDFCYWSWWEECSSNTEQHQLRIPTTLSGRTFSFLLASGWWEPSKPSNREPVVYFVGGHQRLTHCFPEIFPARLWTEKFAWKPALSTPFLWLCGDRPVIRFEVLHGPTRRSRAFPARQPVLHRWIAKKDAWEIARGRLGNPRRREDFVRVKSHAEK